MKKITYVLSIIALTASLALAIPIQIASPASQQEGQKAGKMVSGQVAAVDATSNQIVLKDKAGKEVSLAVDTSTKITKGGKDIPLTDVKTGEMATAEVMESDGVWKALSISIA
jgi:hypothetical protein